MSKGLNKIASSPEWVVRIAQSLAGLVDLRAAVTAVSEELNTLIPHEHFDIALLSLTDDTLIVYETGLETAWGMKLGRVIESPIRDVFTGRVDHMIFEDAVLDDRVQFAGADIGPIRKFGLRSRLHHKIEISREIVGALSVSSLQPHAYSREHLAVIQTVANVVGPYFHALRTSELAQSRAIELERQKILRSEAKHLVEVQEKERNRIGMDLHDHVLADMSRLLRSLNDDTLSRTERLREACNALSSAIEDVRGIVEDARPTLLEMFGLGTAIEANLHRAIKGSDIRAIMATQAEDIDEAFDIGQREKLLIFRIIQEAINNAVMHAQASQISIILKQPDGLIELAIEDDGIGIAVGPGTRKSGLRNMSARAAMIDAKLRIIKLDTGTQIALTLARRTEDI